MSETENDVTKYIDEGVYVSKFYEMNPQTDDLLATGDQLREGMVVLIEDSMVRADDEHIMSRYDTERARENNRWCTVSEIQINGRSSFGEYGQVTDQYSMLSFVGIYEDGVKKKRSYNVSYAWLVKKDSIPAGEKHEFFTSSEDMGRCNLVGCGKSYVDGNHEISK